MGAPACTASASRRVTSVRDGGAGWTGADTVRPVRTIEPLLWGGASAASSRTRVGVSVRLTTRPVTGSAGAPPMRRRTGIAGRPLASAGRPGPSGTARSGRVARSRGTRAGARARGAIDGLPGVGALRRNPVPALPSRGITAVAVDPRIDSAIARVGAAAGASWRRRPRWWNRPSPMQGEKNGSHSARSSNTFCWNPMTVQSVHDGYIGYWTPVSCYIATYTVAMS